MHPFGRVRKKNYSLWPTNGCGKLLLHSILCLRSTRFPHESRSLISNQPLKLGFIGYVITTFAFLVVFEIFHYNSLKHAKYVIEYPFDAFTTNLDQNDPIFFLPLSSPIDRVTSASGASSWYSAVVGLAAASSTSLIGSAKIEAPPRPR